MSRLDINWYCSVCRGFVQILRVFPLHTSQAKLINKFAPKDVWSNVIIVAKQSMSPEDDGRGAMAAALEYHSGAYVQLLGYR
jgi:hypothetical protein